MTEPMREALTNLREHTPTLPSVKDAGEAVRSHLPDVDLDAMRGHLTALKEVDTSAITERVRSKARSKWTLAAMVAAIAAAAAAAAKYARAKRAAAAERATTPPNMYTPPLPKA